MIRDVVPDVAITTDIIVGFPGETEAEAEESLAFCREAGFTLMHVFPYSRRPGTSAHLLTQHVAEPVKRARMGAMLAVARESAAAYRRGFVGRTMPVLWETRVRRGDAAAGASAEHPGAATDGGHDNPASVMRPGGDANGVPVWEGLTDNYIRVYARTAGDVRNQIVPVRLVAEAGDGLWGEPDSGASAGCPVASGWPEDGRATPGRAGSGRIDGAERGRPAFIPFDAG